MKRIVLAALAALVLLAPANVAWGHGGGGGGGGHGGGGHGGGHYVYVPGFMFVGGPARVPDAEVGSYAAVHKVAILSSLGTQFGLSDLGGGGASMALDISAWKVDELIASTLRQYLNGRFEFVDMDFDRAAVNGLPAHFMRESKTLALFKTFTNPGVDAYLRVRPAASFVDGVLPGLDVAAARLQNTLLLNYEIDVIDARTLRYISQSIGRTVEREGDEAAFPSAQLPFGFWIGMGMPLSPVKLHFLQRQTEQLMKQSLVETIRSLQFGMPLPLPGDHSIAEPVFAEQMAAVHSVAVISAVGRQFQLMRPGNLFIKTLDTEIASDSWGIDDTIESAAREVLSRHYTVKQVAADRDMLSQVQLIAGMQIPQQLPGLTPTSEVDAYVVIVTATSPAGPYRGLGLRHWAPLLQREWAVFADYAIVVVDARTLKPLAGSVAVPALKSPCARPIYSGAGVPECLVDESLWPDTPDKLTDKAAAEIRRTLTTILTGSVPETLFDLGLDAPDAPPQAPPQAPSKP